MNRLVGIFTLLVLIAVTFLPEATVQGQGAVDSGGPGGKQRCVTGNFRYLCTGCRKPKVDLPFNGCFSGKYSFCSDINYCPFCTSRCTCKRTNCCYINWNEALVRAGWKMLYIALRDGTVGWPCTLAPSNNCKISFQAVLDINSRNIGVQKWIRLRMNRCLSLKQFVLL